MPKIMSERVGKERRHARVKQCNSFVNVSLNTQSETWKLTISYPIVVWKNKSSCKSIYKLLELSYRDITEINWR